MGRKIKKWIMIGLFWGLAGPVSADILQLKSGKILEGQIVEQAEDHYMFRTDAMLMKIWKRTVDEESTKALNEMRSGARGRIQYFQVLGFYQTENKNIHTVFCPHRDRIKIRDFGREQFWQSGQEVVVFFLDIRNAPIQTGREFNNPKYKKHLVAKYIKNPEGKEDLIFF